MSYSGGDYTADSTTGLSSEGDTADGLAEASDDLLWEGEAPSAAELFPVQAREVRRVLVTGASGFIGGYVVTELLRSGFRVRGTVRSERRKENCMHLRAAAERMAELRSGGLGLGGGASTMGDGADVPAAATTVSGRRSRLELVVADLMDADSWIEAVRGCSHVIHVATAIMVSDPEDESALIQPAVDGTLNVLRAAAAAGVKRVVVTSSSSAVYHGQVRPPQYIFSEKDWTDITRPQSSWAYNKAKTLAERAAFTFAQSPEARGLEVTTMCPTLVLGPLMTPSIGTSPIAVKKLLGGSMPGLPDLTFNIVDVRDVARAHVLGMLHPDAPMQRYLLTSEEMDMRTMASTVYDMYHRAGFWIPRVPLPYALLYLVSYADSTLAMVLPSIGRPKRATSDKARRMLGVRFRPAVDSVYATAKSIVDMGLVEPRAWPSGRVQLVAGTTLLSGMVIATALWAAARITSR